MQEFLPAMGNIKILYKNIHFDSVEIDLHQLFVIGMVNIAVKTNPRIFQKRACKFIIASVFSQTYKNAHITLTYSNPTPEPIIWIKNSENNSLHLTNNKKKIRTKEDFIENKTKFPRCYVLAISR